MKIFSLLVCLAALSSAIPVKGQNAARFNRLALANDIEVSLQNELLDIWYPACVDTLYGGFLSTFTFDFKPTGPQDKFIVTQARHTWTAAKASELYPEDTWYLQCARHGYKFLRDVMWDKQYGGFYSLVDRQGHDKSDPQSPKTAYGNAFAIYALAAYYKASDDAGALDLAKQAFDWMEKHSHDAVFKGYYQHLERDGTTVKRPQSISPASDLGYKDQNSSIHLLEALTELYSVWPDSLVRQRLLEMLLLVRDKITNNKGNLVLFFTPDWRPVSFRDSSEAIILQRKNLDHVSFGHDVETAYLLLEASQALGIKDDAKTLMMSKKMLDQALVNGWDDTVGGFYDEGYYFNDRDTITIIAGTKNWWAQAEGLNTLLLMADIFPGDEMHYYDKFLQQWHYINTYLIDHEHGDWYDAGLDKSPERSTALKGQIWKGAYHNFRSLADCVERLRKTDN